MPLNRPALMLGPGPRSVQDARRWVVGTFNDIDRDDIVECAELGVSELVTNALLHAEAPISVRVRGTRQHPRVEVRDGSTHPPVLPEPEESDEDELLLTFGRGLTIVARAADAWGVEIEDDGKIVWFAPSDTFAEEEGVPGQINGAAAPEAADDSEGGDAATFTIMGVPVSLYLQATRHFAELRREIRLLALAHQDDYPLAKNLADVFASFERRSTARRTAQQVEEALARGRSTIDIKVSAPRDSVARLDVFREMLDLADEFCRSERLLSLARTDEQRDFQHWFLGEFLRQSEGHPPQPWRPDRSDRSEVAETNAQ